MGAQVSESGRCGVGSGSAPGSRLIFIHVTATLKLEGTTAAIKSENCQQGSCGRVFRTVSGTFLSECMSSVMVIAAVTDGVHNGGDGAMTVVMAEATDGDEAVAEVGGYGGDGDDVTLHR